MIKQFKAMPLNTSIYAATVVPLLVVYIAVGLSIWSILTSLADKQLESKANQLIASTSALLQSALISGDKKTGRTLLSSVAENVDVVSVTLKEGKAGAVFAAAQGEAKPSSELMAVTGIVSRELFNESLWSTKNKKAYETVLGRIEVVLSRERTESAIYNVMGKIAIVAVVVLIFAIFLGWIIGLRISRPLRAIGKDVARITQGDYSVQLSLDRDDEIGVLSQNIDTMAEELSLQMQELLSSREEAERSNEHKGVLLAAISREFSQPLTATIANLQKALKVSARDKSVDDIRRALEHVEYLSELNVDVEMLAQSENGNEVMRASPFTIGQVIASLVDSYKDKLRERGIDLQVDWGPNTQLANEVIHSDPIRLRVLLNNMIDYSVHSFTNTGDIVIRLFLRKTTDAMEIMIDMINSGVSATEESVDATARLLETNDSDVFEDGIAFGNLPIELRTAHRIARSLGGKFSLHSTFSQGALVSVHLVAESMADDKQYVAPLTKTSQKIMIIENSHNVQNIAISYLRSKGVTVDEFHRVSDAIIAARRNRYTMIFIDSDLEDMNAATAAHEIKALPYHQETMLIALVNDREQLSQDAFSDTLRKPVTGNQVYNIIEGCAKVNDKIQSFTH